MLVPVFLGSWLRLYADEWVLFMGGNLSPCIRLMICTTRHAFRRKPFRMVLCLKPTMSRCNWRRESALARNRSGTGCRYIGI